MKLHIFRYTAIGLLCMAFATTASARSWRIHHDAKRLADFADINAAVASDQVQDGDTLYLDPGCTITTQQNVTKTLTIVGTGFTGASQPYGYATISGALYLKAANIKVMSTIVSGRIYIQASDITVERCRASYGIEGNSSSPNAIIRQCHVTNGQTNNRTAINVASSTNWTIENCIINPSSSYSIAISRASYSIIRNNILTSDQTGNYYTLSASNSTITNNIIINTSYADHAFNGDSGQLTNNVISQEVNADYNHVGVLATADVFTGDIQSYTLTDESPAKNYGTDGTDCGIFGGLYPYVKGGRPQGHPYYTEVKVASKPDANDKLRVSFKIKMNDE